MYRMDNVPASETRRHLPMDVLVVLRWAKSMIGSEWEGPNGMMFRDDSDRAHWEALTELCEER